ncbi:MAG: hypothetical protein AAFV53_35975 [Myxococcota bacterium]
MAKRDDEQRLREAAQSASGELPPPIRGAIQAAAATALTDPTARPAIDPTYDGYIDAVVHRAHQIDDADLDAMRDAGLSDRALFEITVNAAVGAGLAALGHARRAQRSEDTP